jgi:hypothetical protein
VGQALVVSSWDDNDLTAKVLELLDEVAAPAGSQHLGRPFISAYQLAIGVERRYPEARLALGKPLGGKGAGRTDSMAQYIANVLSRQIKAQGEDHPIEGAFLAEQDLADVVFVGPHGPLQATLNGSRFSLFRRRN